MTESFGPRPARPVRPTARIAALTAACFVAFSAVLFAASSALPVQVRAATATPTPAPVEHVYSVGGATAAEADDAFSAALQDAIGNQYARFDVGTTTAAANGYVDIFLNGTASVAVRYQSEFNVASATAHAPGSAYRNGRGFDYEVGIYQSVGVSIAGAQGAAYAKTFRFTIVWKETRAQREKVMAHVRAFLGSAAYPADGTDEQKLTAINRYITTTFDYDTTRNNGSPAAMVDPASPYYLHGVCQAYTLYGYLMLTEAGYDARTILTRFDRTGKKHGPTATGDGTTWGSHGWLLVKVGARWYHMDFTWNDPVGGTPDREYYLRTDAQIGTDHRWRSSPPLAEANTGAAYYPACSTAWAGTPAPTPTVGPSPTPKPTAAATPKPTPKPTSKPTATTAPVPTATLAPTGAADPTAPATATPAATAAPSPAPSPSPTPEPLADPTVPLTAAPGGTRQPPGSGGFLQQALDAFLAGWRTDPAVAVATTFAAAALLLLGLHLANPRGAVRKHSGTLDAENGEP